MSLRLLQPTPPFKRRHRIRPRPGTVRCSVDNKQCPLPAAAPAQAHPFATDASAPQRNKQLQRLLNLAFAISEVEEDTA